MDSNGTGRRRVTMDEHFADVSLFLDEVEERLFAPPHPLDLLFGQDRRWVRPGSLVKIAENGCLYADVAPHSKPWLPPEGGPALSPDFSHCLWLHGDALRYAVFFKNFSFGTAFVDWETSLGELSELGQFWLPKASKPHFIARGSTAAVEWVFDLNGRNLAVEPALRAFFSQGVRHVHFRLLDLVAQFVESDGR